MFPRKKSPRVLGWFTVAFAGLTPALASAQQVSGEVSVQRFDPAPGPRNFITTRGARTDGEMAWTAGFMANYAYNPFIVTQCRVSPCSENDPSYRRIPVVENMVTGDFYGSLTVIPQLQLGLKVPVSWVRGQGLDANGNPISGGISTAGLGDVQLEAKGRLYGDVEDPFVLGVYGYGTLPMGNLTAQGSYIGSGTAAFGGALVGDVKLGELTFGANLGGLYRGEAVIGAGNSLGPELRWSAAVGYQVGPVVRVVADAFGSTNFTSNLGANSIEIDLGAQIRPLGSPLTFHLGGGVAAFRGVGTPDARAFLGVVYSADVRDRDQDGIIDAEDACPADPEDKDGFEDSDGCPELDNDNDGIPDSADKCPNEPEDVDGFEDEDGCPDPDNDGDGIPDLEDHCPLEKETLNGVDDLDGCPDAKDTDGDGVPDDVDQCPEEPEDTDGFQDTDGCPDPDNDGDGIPDLMDECIDQPEDGKGKGREKEDGCPLEG